MPDDASRRDDLVNLLTESREEWLPVDDGNGGSRMFGPNPATAVLTRQQVAVERNTVGRGSQKGFISANPLPVLGQAHLLVATPPEKLN
jgi:hypothetical protein